jgi:hypothetical protein
VARFLDKDWDEARITAAQEIFETNALLDRFDAATPKKCKTVFLEGNHERRLLTFFVNNAAKLGMDFKGLLIEEQLHFAERGYEYIGVSKQPHKIGKIGFVHGWYCNKYHANKTVEAAGQNLIYGHKHDYQVATGTHLDAEAPKMAMSIGCLCKFRQAYLEGKPMNWIHGVGIIYVDIQSGHFWPYFAPIIAGRAIIDGRVYSS